MVLVEEEDVPVLVEGGGGEAAVEEGEAVHLVVLLLRRLHLLHLLHVQLRQPRPRLRLLWPQASAEKILQRHEHEHSFCLQCKRVPIMMHLVIIVVGVRVTRIPHLQGLVNDLLVLHMFLMRLELVQMLLV